MNYVFISYSSKNRCTADAVRVLLQNNGMKCWMAPYDIPVGQKYAGVINKAIRGCGCFLLLLTNDSQQSVWVAKEVERAVNYNKSVITIKLEDVVLNDEFELYISSEHMVAVSGVDASDENMQRVLKAIAALVGEDEAQPDDSITIDTIDGVRVFDGGELKFGDIINEKYSIGTKVGEGGFGNVYTATNVMDFAHIAIKISRMKAEEGYYVSESTLDRIMQVKSPYLCRIFEHFMFMGKLCVVEEDLHRHVGLRDYAEIAGLDVKESILLVMNILEGLKALHDNGIYHGDISPYNIMVSNGGIVKLTDYSSSYLIDGTPTGEHTLILSYVAPDAVYTESSEVFSVGVVAFELITNSHSTRGEDGRFINNGRVIDEALGNILNKAAALECDGRYKSADEFAEALREYILSCD